LVDLHVEVLVVIVDHVHGQTEGEAHPGVLRILPAVQPLLPWRRSDEILAPLLVGQPFAVRRLQGGGAGGRRRGALRGGGGDGRRHGLRGERRLLVGRRRRLRGRRSRCRRGGARHSGPGEQEGGGEDESTEWGVQGRARIVHQGDS